MIEDIEQAARRLERALSLPYAILAPEDKELVRQYWTNQQRAELRELNRRYGVIESLRELYGFTILGLDRYKPGVVRFHAVDYSKMIFRSGLAKDELFASYQLPK